MRKDSLVEHMDDAARMNIEVVPPDVNTSHVEFAVGDGKILLWIGGDQELWWCRRRSDRCRSRERWALPRSV